MHSKSVLGDEQNYGRFYKTDYFYNRFEKIARQNMKIEKLFWQGAL